MQVENYEPTERDIKRAEAHLSNPAIKKKMEQELDFAHKILEWRIQHEGYQLKPEMVAAHEAWRAKHPELYTNPHK